MATVTFEKTFTAKDAADAFAQNYASAMWGYDPIIRITATDGMWVVMITRSAACD